MKNFCQMMKKLLSGVEYWPLPSGEWNKDFLKAGFVFYEVGTFPECWYVYVELPKGWRFKVTNEYVTEIYDSEQNFRGDIIIAEDNGALTYASAYLRPRYVLGYYMEADNNSKSEDKSYFVCITLTDLKENKKVLVHKSADPIVTDVTEILNSTLDGCKTVLDQHFPSWREQGCWNDNDNDGNDIETISEIFSAMLEGQ